MSRPASALGAVAAAFLVLLLLAWLFQRRLIYLPTGRVPPVGSTLAGAEEVSFRTEDGLQLNAWFLPAGSAGGPPARRRPAVLFFPGNAGNRAYRAPLAEALAREGFSVLLVDYRGYGGNPGAPSQEGLLADARAARSYLSSRTDVDPGQVAYFGESLGTAVAVGLAADVPPAAVVLRSPFPSLVALGRHHYPFLPVGLLLEDRFPAATWIRDVTAPVLVVLGGSDRIVPPEESRALFAAAHQPKKLVEIPGAGHNDFDLLAGEQVVRAVVEFLRELR